MLDKLVSPRFVEDIQLVAWPLAAVIVVVTLISVVSNHYWPSNE